MRFVATNFPAFTSDTGNATLLSAGDAELEDLLRELAQSSERQPNDARGRLALLTIAFVALSACWLGYVLGTRVMILAKDDGAIETVAARTGSDDASPAADIFTAAVSSSREKDLQAAQPDILTSLFGPTTLTDGDVLEPMTFRGSLEDSARVAPVADPVIPQRPKPRRATTRIKPVVVQAAAEQPAPPPTLLEKLFGLRFPSS